MPTIVLARLLGGEGEGHGCCLWTGGACAERSAQRAAPSAQLSVKMAVFDYFCR